MSRDGYFREGKFANQQNGCSVGGYEFAAAPAIDQRKLLSAHGKDALPLTHWLAMDMPPRSKDICPSADGTC